MVRVALSSWSLHDALGRLWNELDTDGKTLVPKSEAVAPTLDLLDMPAAIAAHGIHTLDICHFHLPSIEDSYLAELRSALADAHVELVQLLIDSGELCHPDPEKRRADVEMNKRWMEIAYKLGATGVRYVPGGCEPTPETIHLSGEAFRELADFAEQCHLEPATENFKSMTQNAEDLLQIVANSERTYGVVADFGNARGPHKYDTLAKLMPHATSLHAWAECDEGGTLNREEFRRCLTMARDNDFSGPILLLGAHPVPAFRQSRDFWEGTNELWAEVKAVFGEDA